MANTAAKVADNKNLPAFDMIPVVFGGADKDLLDTGGITGGYAARCLYITGAGTVVFDPAGAPGGVAAATRTVTVADGTFLDVIVRKLYQTSTATGIHVMV